MLKKMASKNTNFATLLFISYVTGITSTVCDYTAEAAYGLADVAHTRRFELALESNSSEWYRDEIKLSAFILKNFKWNKSPITWAIVQDASRVPKSTVVQICTTSFKTWSGKIPRDFRPATPDEKPDIRISFIFGMRQNLGETHYPAGPIDQVGADIYIDDMASWVNSSEPDYHSLPHVVLHEIGHALGLDHSNDILALMHKDSPAARIPQRIYTLADDDVKGIQALYGKRSVFSW